jgi:flagellar protein FlaJ
MGEFAKNISKKLYGGIVSPYKDYFDALKLNLKRARIETSVDDYICMIIFYAFPIVFVATLLIFSVLIAFVTLFATYSFSLAVLIAGLCSAATFFIGYEYPSFAVRNVKNRIEKSLPFAALHMTTAAKSGMNPVDVFKVLIIRGGVIGKEAEKIYNSVKYMGMNLTTAMQRSAIRTPSDGFADLLYGMISVISSGGNLEAYLTAKTKALFAEHRRRLNEYANNVSLYAEIYITLVIVGSILFLILLSILSPLVGTGLVFLQAFLVFIFTPLVSVAFMIILKTVSPEE